jgi:hypothetical protein
LTKPSHWIGRNAEKLSDADERQDVISYLAQHPKVCDVMEGTGGVRKLRWSRGTQGKSGGVRVIYYFHNESMPLYLLTLFAKNGRTKIGMTQRQSLTLWRLELPNKKPRISEAHGAHTHPTTSTSVAI